MVYQRGSLEKESSLNSGAVRISIEEGLEADNFSNCCGVHEIEQHDKKGRDDRHAENEERQCKCESFHVKSPASRSLLGLAGLALTLHFT